MLRRFPIGFYRVDGAEWLPRGTQFTMRLCALEPEDATMFLLYVGVTADNGVGQRYLSTDPSQPLVIEGSDDGLTEVGQNYRSRLRVAAHDHVSVRFDHDGSLSFGVNGRNLGVAFAALHAQYVRPAAMLYLPNSISFAGDVEYF